MSAEQVKTEIIGLTQKLLNSISGLDWATYSSLTDDNQTCFEGEAQGELVHGQAFHKFFFDHIPKGSGPPSSDTIANPHEVIVSPHVQMLGDSVALIAYIRLRQFKDPSGGISISKNEETRIWQKQSDGTWKSVHFHRSKCMENYSLFKK